jgi:hypothetical protein
MSTLEETRLIEASTRAKWRTVERDYAWIKQEGWFEGRRIVRFKKYGTLANPHAPSRWRISGYQAGGKDFDFFSDALAYAKGPR